MDPALNSSFQRKQLADYLTAEPAPDFLNRSHGLSPHPPPQFGNETPTMARKESSQMSGRKSSIEVNDDELEKYLREDITQNPATSRRSQSFRNFVKEYDYWGEACVMPNDDELQRVYYFVDSVPLTRTKRNLNRDFTDCSMMAQVIKYYLPPSHKCIIEVWNYIETSKNSQKLANWSMLNKKVLSKLGRYSFSLTKEHIYGIIHAKPGAIERALIMLQKALSKFSRNSPIAPQAVRSQQVRSSLLARAKRIHESLSSKNSKKGSNSRQPRRRGKQATNFVEANKAFLNNSVNLISLKNVYDLTSANKASLKKPKAQNADLQASFNNTRDIHRLNSLQKNLRDFETSKEINEGSASRNVETFPSSRMKGAYSSSLRQQLSSRRHILHQDDDLVQYSKNQASATLPQTPLGEQVERLNIHAIQASHTKEHPSSIELSQDHSPMYEVNASTNSLALLGPVRGKAKFNNSIQSNSTKQFNKNEEQFRKYQETLAKEMQDKENQKKQVLKLNTLPDLPAAKQAKKKDASFKQAKPSELMALNRSYNLDQEQKLLLPAQKSHTTKNMSLNAKLLGAKRYDLKNKLPFKSFVSNKQSSTRAGAGKGHGSSLPTLHDISETVTTNHHQFSNLVSRKHPLAPAKNSLSPFVDSQAALASESLSRSLQINPPVGQLMLNTKHIKCSEQYGGDSQTDESLQPPQHFLDAIDGQNVEASSMTQTAAAEGRADQEYPPVTVPDETSSGRVQNRKVRELEQTLSIMVEKMGKMEELLKIKDSKIKRLTTQNQQLKQSLEQEQKEAENLRAERTKYQEAFLAAQEATKETAKVAEKAILAAEEKPGSEPEEAEALQEPEVPEAPRERSKENRVESQRIPIDITPLKVEANFESNIVSGSAELYNPSSTLAKEPVDQVNESFGRIHVEPPKEEASYSIQFGDQSVDDSRQQISSNIIITKKPMQATVHRKSKMSRQPSSSRKRRGYIQKKYQQQPPASKIPYYLQRDQELLQPK